MLSLRGFAAYVEVQIDGLWKVAEEYKTTSSGANAVSAFIESRAGCHYRIVIKEESKQHGCSHFGDWSGVTYVDGQRMMPKALSRNFPVNNPVTVSGKVMGPAEIMPFVFSKLALTDQDDLATKDEQVVKNMGIISLQFHRIQLGPPMAHTDKFAPIKHTLHEKAKKGGSLDHSTSYGAIQTTAHTPLLSSTWIDPLGYPSVTIEFKYRSGDLLEADGIKPASEPVPAAVQDQPARSESRESSGTPIPVAGPSTRRKATETTEDATKRVKQEKKPFISSTKGQIIDIDDDDDDSELVRLRNEVALLRRKAKHEPGPSQGGVIDISD